MSERARVVVIVLALALLAGGGGYYYLKMHLPAQELKSAQDEVERWEKRYQDARGCLLGKTPGSAKTSEALAIREMTPDPWDGNRCTPLMGKLSRGPAPSTGMTAVEDAWMALEAASSKAAIAFARHVSESTTLKQDPLPAALDELDNARKALRVAVRMPSADTEGSALPPAVVVPIADGKQPVQELVLDALPSAHGMIAFGSTDSRTVQVKLTTGDATEVARVGPRTIRAVPDMSWGATATDEGVDVGLLDLEGVIANPTTFTLASPHVVAVGGTLVSGAVVYRNGDEVAVARRIGKGLVAAPPLPVGIVRAGVDVDGRVALVWGDAGKVQGTIMTLGDDDAVVELPPKVSRLCLTKDRAWTQSYENDIDSEDAETAVSFGGGRPTFRRELSERLVGCTPDGALFRSNPPTRFVFCSDDCQTIAMPAGAPDDAAVTIVDGKLVAIATHAGVLGRWREDAKPTFFAVPDRVTPMRPHVWTAMALTDGKIIDVIARSETGFVVVRIPAA